MKRLLLICFLIFGLVKLVSAISLIGSGVTGGGVVNGSVGNGTQDTPTLGTSANRIYHSEDTASVAGTVQWGHAYIADGNGYTFYIYLYAQDGTQLTYCTVVGTDGTPGWYECQAASPYVIDGVTSYWYGIGNGTGAATIAKNATGHDGQYYDAETVDTATVLNPKEATNDADGNVAVIWNNISGTP